MGTDKKDIGSDKEKESHLEAYKKFLDKRNIQKPNLKSFARTSYINDDRNFFKPGTGTATDK